MNGLQSLPIGDKAPEEVNVVIEIPKGSQNKYEFDEHAGVFRLDRVIYSPVKYPLDYGFIPATRSEDGDHLDALVLGSDPLFPGCVVDMRPIGLLNMIDGGEADEKILGVQVKNPRYSEINDIADIEKYNPHLLKEISHFFQTYKDLQGKKVELKGWEGVARAKEEIKKAEARYQNEG
jgi:inorganic pyrophosphatase